MKPILYIVVPCYNEEAVLPVTAPHFLSKLTELIRAERIHADSRILYVNDGSTDGTWSVICSLADDSPYVRGIALSHNRGHQNALLAGLTEVTPFCDVTVSIDCDGQDDISAIDRMLDAYADGCDVVYGVRESRASDTPFKRVTAEGFYRLLRLMGAEVVFNHADYRLLSKRVLLALAEYKEVNLYLRGMLPLIGFRSTSVPYVRTERMAGKTHYPLRKMLSLAFDGITSLSVRPIRIITAFGALTAFLGFVGVIWAIVRSLTGATVAGWASTVCIVCFMGGIQLLSLGVIGEYIGKIYLETKARPRFIVSERTETREDRISDE